MFQNSMLFSFYVRLFTSLPAVSRNTEEYCTYFFHPLTDSLVRSPSNGGGGGSGGGGGGGGGGCCEGMSPPSSDW